MSGPETNERILRTLVNLDSFLYLGRDKVRGFGTKYGVKHYSIVVFHSFECDRTAPSHMIQTISFSNQKSMFIHFDPKDLSLWKK